MVASFLLGGGLCLVQGGRGQVASFVVGFASFVLRWAVDRLCPFKALIFTQTQSVQVARLTDQDTSNLTHINKKHPKGFASSPVSSLASMFNAALLVGLQGHTDVFNNRSAPGRTVCEWRSSFEANKCQIVLAIPDESFVQVLHSQLAGWVSKALVDLQPDRIRLVHDAHE